jgi:hypothetical protein
MSDVSSHPMLRALTAVGLLIICQGVLAESVTRTKGEDARSFAARHAPHQSAEVVEVFESTAWNFRGPAVFAFYKYSVVYADKSKNYGSDPNESEVAGYLFVPTSEARYERIEIDSYGPEGTSAEIGKLSFARKAAESNPILFIEVYWHPGAGDLHQTCAYEKPHVSPLPRKLKRLEGYGRCDL